MNALTSIRIAVVLLFLTLPVSAHTTKLYGDVVGVTDGDPREDIYGYQVLE